MKNVIRILAVTVLFTASHMVAAGETAILKYGSQHIDHELYISDGKVIGGESHSGQTWFVSGGAYDGRNLHVTFTSPQREGCNSWFTHIYEVNSMGPRMLAYVDKCGVAHTDLAVQYYWESRPGSYQLSRK